MEQVSCTYGNMVCDHIIMMLCAGNWYKAIQSRVYQMHKVSPMLAMYAFCEQEEGSVPLGTKMKN